MVAVKTDDITVEFCTPDYVNNSRKSQMRLYPLDRLVSVSMGGGMYVQTLDDCQPRFELPRWLSEAQIASALRDHQTLTMVDDIMCDFEKAAGLPRCVIPSSELKNKIDNLVAMIIGLAKKASAA